MSFLGNLSKKIFHSGSKSQKNSSRKNAHWRSVGKVVFANSLDKLFDFNRDNSSNLDEKSQRKINFFPFE